MAKRRANGEGSITKRKDGKWQASALIGWDAKKNQPKRVYFYGKTQAEVKRKLQDAIHRHEKEGGYIESSRLYFGEWIDIWYNEYAKANVRPTTWDNYGRWINNHIKPGLGGILLCELQPNQIQKFYNRKLKERKLNGRPGTLSPRSVRYMHVLINECLEQALKEGKIYRNPAKATKPPKQVKKEAAYLNEEQIINFLGNISTDRWFTAFITVLGTGLRLGELCALKWENVDLEKRLIHVKESVSRVKNEDKTGPKTKLIFQPPKTAKGKRIIPIPEEVVTDLKKWKSKQTQEELKIKISGLYKNNGFVFTWEDGRMIEPGTLSKHFLKLMRANGLEGIHFHNLRHSYASLLLKAGEHPKVVQELLGHSTIQVTMDIYSHVDPEIKEKAAESINDVFKKKKPSLAEEGN